MLKNDFYKMRKLINRIPMARFRLDKAISRATKVTTVLTGMPRGSGGGSQTEEGALLVMLAREKYDTMQAELNELQARLSPYIKNMDDALQKNVLRMRYIECRSVREIAYCLNYSEQHIFRILQKAETKVEKESVNSEK
jgi:RNA polymerase sigma factor (sigma-70 family)